MSMWEDEIFGVTALSVVINDMPRVPSQIADLGVFEEDGVNVTVVEIEEENGQLNLIEPTPRGGPGNTVDDTQRSQIAFSMDHFEINDSVRADEVQGVRVLGGDPDQAETVVGRIETKQARHARSFDATLEHQRIGALKGLITSKNGKQLHNLYSRFGIAVPAPVPLGIHEDNSDLPAILQEQVLYSIEDALDEAHDGVHVFTGRNFHQKMWLQNVVRETFLGTNGSEVLRRGVPDIFDFGDITFERYKTGRRAKEGNNGENYIGDDEARAFPTGVPEMYLTRFGPADLEETVNTIGLPRYTHQYPMPNGKGRHLDSQMNQISLCTRPGALRKLTIQ